MADAFAWLERHQPADDVGSLTSAGATPGCRTPSSTTPAQIVGALDWEQACICPAEADLAWWLATRRQTLEVQGLDADPELPGFDSRAAVIRRYEEMIGRELDDLDWYEMFAMVRMGCCILRTQVLLRSIGQGDHFLRAPILPAWAVEAIRA